MLNAYPRLLLSQFCLSSFGYLLFYNMTCLSKGQRLENSSFQRNVLSSFPSVIFLIGSRGILEYAFYEKRKLFFLAIRNNFHDVKIV